MLVAISISPSGSPHRGTPAADGGVSEAVAAAVQVVRDSGLPHELNAMFTNIEGEWDEVMAVVKRAVDVLAEVSPRVGLVLKADIRPGHDGQLTAKVERIEQALAAEADRVAQFTNGPLLQVPRHPPTAIRLGLRALEQGTSAWNLRFRGDVAPAMLTGVAAHSIQHVPSLATAAAALSLGAYAHGRGWPVPIGGSQAIVDALAADLVAHGARTLFDAADDGRLDHVVMQDPEGNEFCVV